MDERERLRDRYAGTLLGLGCGDALGGPVEFRSRAQIARDHPGGLREFVGGGWLHLAPGEVTDDTQMTLALAEALTERGLEMDRLTETFLAWFRSKPKDVGTTTTRSLRVLAAGAPWQEAGAGWLADEPPGTVAGNGAVMRCAPVALRFRTDPEALRAASLDSARITHAEPRAAWGAVAVNQAIAHLLDGGGLDDLAEAAAAGVAEPEVREAALGAAARSASELSSGGFVLDTVRSAFWALLNHDGAEEVIVAAVALGEDADTTGAVAGALAGARCGASALPRRWLDRLQRRDALRAHADRLLALSEAG